MSVRIYGPDSLTLPAGIGGDRLDSVRIKRDVIASSLGGGQTALIGISRDSIPLADAKRMVNAGATIYGLEVWFELVTAAVLDRPHPLAPDRSPRPTETWAEYGVFGNSHAPVGPFSGKYYRSSCIGVSGEPLEASLWTDWIDSPPSGVVVKTVDEVRTIFDTITIGT